MKKVIIEFTEDENGHFDTQEVVDTLNVDNYKLLVDAIRQELFRPARKHGYDDRHIQGLVDKLGDDAVELIGHLEDRYNDLLDRYDIQDI